MMHRTGMLLAGLVFLFGCASQPGTTTTTPPQPPAGLAIPEGMAELYLFNDSGKTLVPSSQEITDNGKTIASLARQTYVRLFITTGPHVLRPDPYLWKQEVRLNAAAGITYYVAIAYKPERSWAWPLTGAPLVMKLLTKEQALPMRNEMRPQ
ncbi:MAG: hypothetical protein KGK44_11390 [Gammaproteobacteria bacterium]|nr:hypothetical protein [Gammaproteobacteria bacterium]